jgi:hypothetical protein
MRDMAASVLHMVTKIQALIEMTAARASFNKLS